MRKIDRDYYYWSSIRRQKLDNLQERYKYLYTGKVLDIGGRDRGVFHKPKDKVKEWIFADINPEYNPDMLLDITDMNQIDSNSIDVINAIELFEHVKAIEKGLIECYRVLKKNGIIIISVPFLSAIHADPDDFQRWTSSKWKKTLNELGFDIQKLIIMGTYHSHLAEIMKIRINSIKRSRILKKLFIVIITPFLNHLVKLDYLPVTKNDSVLNKFHTGYFIIAKKK